MINQIKDIVRRLKLVILAAAVTLLSEREASETVENKTYQKLKKEKMKCNFKTRFIFYN